MPFVKLPLLKKNIRIIREVVLQKKEKIVKILGFNISSLQSVILKTLSLVSILFSCLYLSLCSSAREVGKIAQNQPKIVIKLSINYNPFGLEISEIFYFRQ